MLAVEEFARDYGLTIERDPVLFEKDRWHVCVPAWNGYIMHSPGQNEHRVEALIVTLGFPEHLHTVFRLLCLGIWRIRPFGPPLWFGPWPKGVKCSFNPRSTNQAQGMIRLVRPKGWCSVCGRNRTAATGSSLHAICDECRGRG